MQIQLESNAGAGQYLVVEVTLMFVTVSMNGAEQSSTATGKPSQANLLLAHLTSVLLLLPVLLAVLVGVLAGGGGPEV